jgi:protein-disulfide isomerase
MGPATAPLQIIEFADFECPHCGGAFRKLRALGAAFPSELRVTFLHFPLDAACNPLVTAPFHVRACYLASLAECAHRQGRFVDAAALLYERVRERSDAELRADVVALGLDAAALDACLADPAAAAAVRSDVDLGLRVKVEGTPTLFANGRKLGRPLTEAVVRELLARPVAPGVGSGSGSGAPPPVDATPPASR